LARGPKRRYGEACRPDLSRRAVLLKDVVAVAGTLTLAGSRLATRLPPATADATIVERYKAAGLVIFGKTATPELGIAASTETSLTGTTRNPWNPARTPGGSSGGSAAAVAARVVPAAHGSDGGGSIRTPASCCGLFGLKPTRARTPFGPVAGEGWGSLASHHVLSSHGARQRGDAGRHARSGAG
jgi:Asp-tRNA(Asn)/Glu-tRNA(Gln) amidotransferase A subunit family amidase